MNHQTADLAELQERIRLAAGMLIATRIRRARRLLGQTQDEFGNAVGIQRQHLLRLEKGRNRPRAETLLRIAEAAGKPVEWFLNPDVDPSPFPEEED